MCLVMLMSCTEEQIAFSVSFLAKKEFDYKKSANR